MAKKTKRGVMSDNVTPIRAETEVRPLPAKAAQGLRDLQAQIDRALAARQAFIEGVLAALDVEGQVNVDLDAMTYTVQAAQE